MKGDFHWGIIFAFVVGMLLLLVAGGYIMSAAGVDVQGSIQQWNPTREPIEHTPAVEMGGLQEVDLTGDNQPTTATKVGCEIARAITSDISAYGYQPRGQSFEEIGADANLKLITTGIFRIRWRGDSFGYYWESPYLNASQRDALKDKCSDTGDMVDCTDKVDEACITALLSNMNITGSTQGICSTFLSTSGEVTFGNNACGSSIAPDWADMGISADCSVWCPGSDMIFSMAAGGEIGMDDQYVALDSNIAENNFPPVCKELGPLGGAGCEPKYMWLLYWNKQSKVYAVEIPKVPVTQEFNGVDMMELGRRFGIYFASSGRFSPAAYMYPELSMVADALVVPAANTLVSQFLINGFKPQIGDGWTIKAEPGDCLSDDSCSKNKLDLIWYKRTVTKKETAGNLNTDIKDYGTHKVVYVRLGGLGVNGQFLSNHLYRIQVFKYHGPDTEKNVPINCGMGEQHCVCKDYSTKCGRIAVSDWESCEEKCGRGNTLRSGADITVKDTTGSFNYRIIIVDLGELLPDLSPKVRYSPRTVVQGETVTFTVTVTNSGSKDAGQFLMDTRIDGKFIVPSDSQDPWINSLAKGASTVLTYRLKMTPGTHNFAVKVDTKGQFQESNIANNDYSTDILVEGTDIAMTDLGVPTGGKVGEELNIAARAANLGTTEQTFNVTLMVNSVLKDSIRIEKLRAGTGQSVTFTWTPESSETANITVVADPANKVPDDVRANNAAEKTITITA